MSEVSEPDEVEINNEIRLCKEVLDTLFYKLFNNYYLAHDLVEADQKVCLALCNTMNKDEDLDALKLQCTNLYSFNCTLIIKDRKQLLKMFDNLFSEHKEIKHFIEINMLKAHLSNQAADERTIQICLKMGGFFILYGLFHNSNVFLTFAASFSKDSDDVALKLKILENLLYLDAVLHRFKKSTEICIASQNVASEAEMITEKYLRNIKIHRYNNNHKELEAAVRLASLYSNYSFLHFTRGRYDLAYQHAISAVKSLTNKDTIRTTLQVCRHASKAFVANQYYTKAKFFIDEAMSRAKMLYSLENKNLNFPEVLADYAYFLKKFGKYKESQAIYVKALKILYKDVFGCRENMHIALVEKDLAETLLERGIHTAYALNLIEHVILSMEQFLKAGDVNKDTTMIVEAYLIKALLLIKQFKRDDPMDRKTRKLHELKIKLERKEKTVALYCGITSSLYTKYFIVLIQIYFTVGNDDYAVMKSGTILNKAPRFCSKNKNLHESIAKAEMASVIINSCKVNKYREYVIEATLILEKSVAVIEKKAAKRSCKELEKYYQTLMVGHRKIVLHRPTVLDPVPFVDKYDFYEMRLKNWKQKWRLLYSDIFTNTSNNISSIPTIINQVKDMKAVI